MKIGKIVDSLENPYLKSLKRSKEFPVIEDFFLKDEPAIILPTKIEKKIAAHMEKLYEKHLIDEHIAIEESKHIFLNV